MTNITSVIIASAFRKFLIFAKSEYDSLEPAEERIIHSSSLNNSKRNYPNGYSSGCTIHLDV